MSHITEVTVFGASPAAIEAVNGWLLEHDTRRQQLKPIQAQNAGGTKLYLTSIHAAALNYAPEGLRALLRDPATWGLGALGVFVSIDSEDDTELTVFGYDSYPNGIADEQVVAYTLHHRGSYIWAVAER